MKNTLGRGAATGPGHAWDSWTRWTRWKRVLDRPYFAMTNVASGLVDSLKLKERISKLFSLEKTSPQVLRAFFLKD